MRAKRHSLLALQSRIHRFALQGKHAEDTFVDPVERFAAYEPFQGFHAEDELPDGERAFGSESPVPEACQVLGCRVFRAVDDPQVFLSPAFYSWLHYPAFSPGHEIKRLDD